MPVCLEGSLMISRSVIGYRGRLESCWGSSQGLDGDKTCVSSPEQVLVASYSCGIHHAVVRVHVQLGCGHEVLVHHHRHHVVDWMQPNAGWSGFDNEQMCW
jgi:hypothetical protein